MGLRAPLLAPDIVCRAPSLRARPQIGTFERPTADSSRAARESSAAARAEDRPLASNFEYVLRMVPAAVVQALKRSKGGIKGAVFASARSVHFCI